MKIVENSKTVQKKTPISLQSQKYAKRIRDICVFAASCLLITSVHELHAGSVSVDGKILDSTRGSELRSSSSSSSSGTYIRLRSKKNGKRLHNSNEVYTSNSAGRHVIAFTSSSSDAQQWRFIDAGGGYKYLKSKKDGKQLHESGETYSSNSAGKYVIAFTSSTGNSQKWKQENASGSYKYFRSKKSGKRLHNSSEVYASNSAGNYAIAFTAGSGSSQQWQIQN